MADKHALITEQLATLLGEPNVTAGEDGIVARPSCGEEIAGIFNLAARAGLTARAARYTVGPSAGVAGETDILILLERMNQIKYDHEREAIIVQPAAEVDQIINVVQETGCTFPGLNCRHKQATVGENVAACFNDGEPDFKCADACLCGMELVLADGGRIISVGERSVKDLDNYQLTYILGGYKEKQAVLSSIHLKLLPGAEKRYWLVTTYKDMAMLPKVWPLLMQRYRRSLDAVAGVKPAAHPGFAAMLRQWMPEQSLDEYPSAVCMLVAVNCPPGELESLGELLTGGLSGEGAIDTFIAGDTYQKLIISTFCNNLLAGLKTNPQLSPVSIEHNDNQSIETGRLAAVYWHKEESNIHLFYID